MNFKRIHLPAAVAAVCLLALSPAPAAPAPAAKPAASPPAQAAPAASTAPATAPSAQSPATGVGQKPVKSTVVFRQPRVQITSRIYYAQKKKILPAGAYDISLVKNDFEDGSFEYAFELRKPNADAVAGVLTDVRQQVLATRAAAAYLGFPLPGEKKRTAEKAARKAAAEGTATSDQPAAAEEVKKEKKSPIVAPIVGEEVRVSYWTKTPLKTFQIYTSIATIPPPSVQ